ncbi:hypothetical protein MP228_006257 [Amoeboaphelidium protococcarum]|nr:hypothetical protein MP228_006257 [Amoeboaphelidium protococcarum]
MAKFQELILALVQENAHTAEYKTVLLEHAVPETSLGCGVPAAELHKKYQKAWYVDVRCIWSIAQKKKIQRSNKCTVNFPSASSHSLLHYNVFDAVIREETENSWLTGLVWKSGVRLQSRVRHSVTEENLEDFDILRDAKPEKLSRESVARGKMTKEIPTVIGSDIYYRLAKVEFPVMQVAHARALDHYVERYRVGKSSKRWAYLWRLVQELMGKKDTDLINSAPAQDADVVSALNERFNKDRVYTRIGNHCMVSVNPYKPLADSSDDSLKSIVSAVKDGVDREQPHVFELVSDVYYNMLQKKDDQSVLFMGESGSGKSTNLLYALRSIITASKSKKKEKVAQRALKALTVMDAFGNAKTVQNDNSSRYGKVCEVQFNNRGKMSGVKMIDYLLERQRVSGVQYNERNFNAFYYMIAGLSAEQKSQWKLQDAGKYQYLVSGTKAHRATNEDVTGFAELVSALKALGFKEKYQTQVFQLLTAILFLGNLEFVDPEMKDDAAQVKNIEELRMVAELLGVRATDLENAMVYKTKLIKKEICTVYLDKDEAFDQRDLLAQTLYSLLWSWLVESMNKRLVDDEPAMLINLVDLFGVENLKDNYFHQFMANYTAEKLFKLFSQVTYEQELELYQKEGVKFDSVSFADNAKILNIFTSTPSGILTNINEESAKSRKRAKISALIETWNEENKSNDYYISFPKKSKSYLFGIKHHSENVNYDAEDFIEINAETASADFVTLFKGGPELRASKNSFIRNLFSEKALNLERSPQNSKTIVNALQVNTPRRKPSRRGRESKKGAEASSKSAARTLASDYDEALDFLFEVLSATQLSTVFCIKSNSTMAANRFDKQKVQNQVNDLGLADLINFKSKSFALKMPSNQFADKFRLALPDEQSSSNAANPIDLFVQAFGWKSKDYFVGNQNVFLSEKALKELTLNLRAAEKIERKKLKAKLREDGGDVAPSEVAGSRVSSYIPGGVGDDDYSEDGGSDYDSTADDASAYGSEYSYMSEAETEFGKEGGADKNGFIDESEMQAEEEEQEVSAVRRNWLRTVTFFTWFIPGRCLEYAGMKRADIQLAWREKVTLCILIVLLSALMLFFITGFTLIFCPTADQYTVSQLTEHNQPQTDMYVAVHGLIYDVTGLRNSHTGGADLTNEWAGKDATACFFYPPDALCDDVKTDPPLLYNDTTCFNHPFDKVLPYFDKKSKSLYKGVLAYQWDDIRQNHAKSDSWFVIVKGDIYDMTEYRESGQRYLGDKATSIIYQSAGKDATSLFDAIGAEGRSALKCMKATNYAGQVSLRDSPQCIFANTLLLVATGILVGILVVKFCSALMIGSQGNPEDYDRFVICQVPCYTEGEESLRTCLDSLATLKYDDKRKLLFIIADGNIIGSGNDRATWRIVLDVLGVDPSIDPPKLSFQSLGEGNKQHNMGKIYTGLYDIAGHLVPYLVVVKVGKDSETRRPGNRGKRDSQMILMRFLQKVHYDEAMSPLELEIYHQMKNVIGVDPSFYEFVLMVDADTEVLPDALNKLVSSMVHDAKIVGLCGETTLSNERDSWITMMQVYEYYISHHLAKAFESLFGSVTCLPGCFCMYRIRSPNKSIPLLISKPVIIDYAVNDVDTLHKKNLLSLGEDRYLTTLMLKHFPNMKMSFSPGAIAKSIAPDRWNVLLSQRRRWINSTIHNLAELLLLPQLCGFCCLSMRFVVFFDLFATLVMPATIGYLGYLIYSAIQKQMFPIISLVLLTAAYGLQIIIFLFRRKFEHIGWMIIYILALPIFSFFIPLYAFWHFDDFSWGNTRIVVGERGGKKHIVDEEPFDPQSIPMKKWSEYEQEMWESESQVSDATQNQSAVSAGYTHITGQVGPYSGFVQHILPAQSLVGPIQAPAEYYQQQPIPPEYQQYSQAQSEVPMQSRPMSMMPGPNGQPMMMPAQPGGGASMVNGFPSDDQIVSQIKSYLATANLMTVTKKQVRDDLAAFFGVDMSPKRDFINKVIEDVLQGRM